MSRRGKGSDGGGASSEERGVPTEINSRHGASFIGHLDGVTKITTRDGDEGERKETSFLPLVSVSSWV